MPAWCTDEEIMVIREAMRSSFSARAVHLELGQDGLVVHALVENDHLQLGLEWVSVEFIATLTDGEIVLQEV